MDDYNIKKTKNFKDIHTMELILDALQKKDKLKDDRYIHVYNFILKSKYFFTNGYHNRDIIMMFYEEIIEYFKEVEDKDVLIVDGNIIKF